MSRFVVRIQGGPVELATEEGGTMRAHFLATRVVEARDEDAARDAALATVRRDLADRDVAVEAQDVHAVAWWQWRLRPPGGFTFYATEDEVAPAGADDESR